MSDNALRNKQPDPTSDFAIEAASQPADTDLWAAFHAAQGTKPPANAGSTQQTEEQLPPGGDPFEFRPLRQQFQAQQQADEQQPTDPTSAFGDASSTIRPGETDGLSSHQLPPGDEPVDLRPLRVRFQEGER